jgi:hypothetical protein
MKLPQVAERFAALGAEAAYSTPAQFTRFIGEEIAK